jgi:hypothetical protein
MEWFSEDVDSCWSKTVSHTEAYLARPMRAKRVDYGGKKRGDGYAQYVERKRDMLPTNS